MNSGRLTSFSSCSLSVTSLFERCLSGGNTLRLKGEPLSNPPPLNSTSLDRRRGNLATPPRTNPMSDDRTDEEIVEQSSAWRLLPICPFSSSDSLDCARRGGHSAIRARTPILGTEIRGCMAGSARPGAGWPFGVWRNGVCWGKTPPPPPPSRRSEELQVTPLSL